jgi:hypothetical protein
MAARRPSLARFAAEVGFIAAAFLCGVLDAPVWITGLVAFAMLAYWSWTRRVALNRLRGAQWATQTLIAIAVLIIVLAGAYWLGLGLRGLHP